MFSEVGKDSIQNKVAKGTVFSISKLLKKVFQFWLYSEADHYFHMVCIAGLNDAVNFFLALAV